MSLRMAIAPDTSREFAGHEQLAWVSMSVHWQTIDLETAETVLPELQPYLASLLDLP